MENVNLINKLIDDHKENWNDIQIGTETLGEILESRSLMFYALMVSLDNMMSSKEKKYGQEIWYTDHDRDGSKLDGQLIMGISADVSADDRFMVSARVPSYLESSIKKTNISYRTKPDDVREIKLNEYMKAFTNM